MKMKKARALLFILVSIIVCLFYSNSYAANIYVDMTLSTNITNGTYSVLRRNNTGTDGKAYRTIQSALNAMSKGDVVIMRGGTYREGAIIIPRSVNGTAWSAGNYNTLKSYPGEWAVLDGQNNLPAGDETAVLGYARYEKDGTQDLKYWRFERFEIKNGRTSDGGAAYGLWANGGPFWVRYLYIHDNNASGPGNNPSGLTGMVWHDSVVEYSWFKDNGCGYNPHHNCTHIGIHSDYNDNYIAANGFPGDIHHTQRNVFRYNVFEGATATAIKYKNEQLLTGRTPGQADYSDTYKDRGDDIHHNIFLGSLDSGIIGRQDFLQIYNNIFDGCNIGILAQEEDVPTLYKQVIYNNTVQNVSDRCIGWFHEQAYYPGMSDYVYGYNYNNILDDSNSWYTGLSGYSAVNGDHWILDRTLFYPATVNEDVTWIKSTDYSVAQWEALRPGVDCFASNAGGLYLGSTAPNKYIINPSYQVEAGKAAGSSGKGGYHPYLPGLRLPSYLGAVNPYDKDWVGGVLYRLKSTSWLRSYAERDAYDRPTWIEGVDALQNNAHIIPAVLSELLMDD